MRKTVSHVKKNIFPVLLLFIPALLPAQEFNSVPLSHAAYELIETASMFGICDLPPSAKPWSEQTVKDLLRQIANDPYQILTAKEIETAGYVLKSFDRNSGLDLKRGKFRSEGENLTFETGLGWESDFSVEAPGGSISTVNFAKIFTAGDFGKFFSWNVAAQGGFIYIEQEERQRQDRPVYFVPSAFPYSQDKQWDGGAISLSDHGAYPAHPGDPALAGGFQAEINGVFFDNMLQLRLGRVRRDWGRQMGTSLFMNARARPFFALEGTVAPLSW
jgi:hypothetical protein